MRSRATLLILTFMALVLGACTQPTEEAESQQSAIERSTFDGLEAALTDAKGSRDALNGLDEQLGAELARVYMGLNSKQVTEYASAYFRRREAVTLRERFARDVDALARALVDVSARAEIKKQLPALAKQRIDADYVRTSWNVSVRCSKAIYDSAVVIANSNVASTSKALPGVLSFAARALRGDTFAIPDPTTGKAVRGTYREIAVLGAGVSDAELDEKIQTDIIVPGMTSRTIDSFSGKLALDESFAPGIDDIEEILEPLSEAPHFFEGAEVTKRALEVALKTRGGDLTGSIRGLATAVPSKFLTGIQTLSVIANVWMAKNAWQEASYAEVAQNLVHATPHMLEAMAAIARYSNSRLIDVAKLTSVSSRLEPIIGLAITALETYSLWQNYVDASNVGTGLAVGGGLLSCVGFAVMLFPPAATAGVIILAVGTAVRFLGEYWASRIAEAEMRANITETLKEIGLSGSTLTGILDGRIIVGTNENAYRCLSNNQYYLDASACQFSCPNGASCVLERRP